MRNLKVKAEREYNIRIDDCAIEDMAPYLNEQIDCKSKLMIVSDTDVAGLYLDKIKNILTCDVKTFVFKSGESSKNFETYNSLIRLLAKEKFNRMDCILALGGGVVGDIAAFAASTYVRGIKLIQVPTSLLAMLDSSIGGKTAIDIDGYKNILGTFYSPHFVYVNLEFLKTLNYDEMQSGKGELYKYCILDNEIYNHVIKNKDRLISVDTVYLALKYKGHIVEIDFKEKNERMLLNLGHTYAHAIETESKMQIKHGIAVYMGIKMIATLSHKMNTIADGFEEKMRVLDDIFKFNLPKLNLNNSSLKEHIQHDKKMSSANKINLVLIEDIGRCFIKKENLKIFNLLDENENN